jgi:hypothetical protein
MFSKLESFEGVHCPSTGGIMRKLGLLLVVLALFGSVTVGAQKTKKRIQAPAPPTPQLVIIQDDRGEGYMVFDLLTGAYKCELCEYDYYFSGVGSIKTDGCMIIFGAVEDGYNMAAWVDLCENKGKCMIQVTKPTGPTPEPWEEVLSDPNLADSEATCEEAEPPPTDMPSEIILQNDVDGSFLYFVTASGEYKFIHCEDNTAMGGVGRVTRSGSWISFEVIAPEYRILASVNLDLKSGKAVIDVFEPIGEMAPMQEIISDPNFADNVPVCGARR